MTTVNSTVLNTSKFQRKEVINVIKTKKIKIKQNPMLHKVQNTYSVSHYRKSMLIPKTVGFLLAHFTDGETEAQDGCVSPKIISVINDGV